MLPTPSYPTSVFASRWRIPLPQSTSRHCLPLDNRRPVCIRSPVCIALPVPRNVTCIPGWRPLSTKWVGVGCQHNRLTPTTTADKMVSSGRELLRAAAADTDYDFDPETVGIADGDVLELFEPVVREWWVDQFGAFVESNGGFFTPPQRGAIPHIHDENNALICAPTGSGKTLASFAAIINELFRRDQQHKEGLDNSVYCLYISPLK